MTASQVLWRAPVADGPIEATVRVPGSKSLTNRHLVLGALAPTPTVLRGALASRDTRLMVEALTALGARISLEGDVATIDSPIIRTGALGQDVRVHCGLAGTVMRFVPPLAALTRARVAFTGDDAALVRPMGPLLEGLRQLGVTVHGGEHGTLPFEIEGHGRISGTSCRIDSSGSSQFLSALLMGATQADAPVTITHTGLDVPSLPHIEMTVEALEAAGAVIERPEQDAAEPSWTVHPAVLSGGERLVEPDLSNAGPFLAAALITGGSVTVPGWPLRTTQAGDAFRDLLAQMGATVEFTDAGLRVTGHGGIAGIQTDLHDVGELTPTISALAALADTPSTLTGIGHLRGHETDRLHAIATEVNRLGGQVTEGAGELRFAPSSLHGGVFQSYQDHRMATAGALIGLRVPDVEVVNIETTSKTLPDFVGMWLGMLHGDRALGRTW